MKKSKLFTAIFAIILAGVVFAQPLAANETSTIRVSGAASVTMAPDVAGVSFRAITTDDDRQVAITDNNNLMADILQILRQHGVEDDDMRTSAFSVWPHFENVRVCNYDVYGRRYGRWRNVQTGY
ncbi:MAG: SIMPL domain-containing protein, partial [Clostridiales bacterium]|nr:SIMPL domain-containing protein [Clostridiales bacterium]